MEDISNFQKRKEKDWQVGNYLIHPQHVLGRGATATVYQGTPPTKFSHQCEHPASRRNQGVALIHHQQRGD